jgi:hypothetical protein
MKTRDTLLLAGAGLAAWYLFLRPQTTEEPEPGIFGGLGEPFDLGGLLSGIGNMFYGIFGGLGGMMGGLPGLPGEGGLPGIPGLPGEDGFTWPDWLTPGDTGGATEPAAGTPSFWEWFTERPEIVQNLAAVGATGLGTYGGFKLVQASAPFFRGAARGAGDVVERLAARIGTRTAAQGIARQGVRGSLMRQWLTRTNLSQYRGTGQRGFVTPGSALGIVRGLGLGTLAWWAGEEVYQRVAQGESYTPWRGGMFSKALIGYGQQFGWLKQPSAHLAPGVLERLTGAVQQGFNYEYPSRSSFLEQPQVQVTYKRTSYAEAVSRAGGIAYDYEYPSSYTRRQSSPPSRTRQTSPRERMRTYAERDPYSIVYDYM